LQVHRMTTLFEFGTPVHGNVPRFVPIFMYTVYVGTHKENYSQVDQRMG